MQLEDLKICECDALVIWPENVFRPLVSLRKLMIVGCNKLTGRTQQASAEQSTTTPGQSVFPSRLESLKLWSCDSLVELSATLPASLRELSIYDCQGLESVILRKQQQDSSSNTRLVGSGDGVVIRQEKSAPLQGSLEELRIDFCQNLRSLSVQLDCTDVDIWECDRLKSLDGDGDHLTSLERLELGHCKSLESIPDGGPQVYSSLRYLAIRSCPRLKVLPLCLKQRLNDIEETRLDARYTGNWPW